MKQKLVLMILTTLIALTTITKAQNVPSYVPTNGLKGWWPFNGNANDRSGNGNNGTVSGAALTTDRFGNLNSAYSFDGLDDYISTNKWLTGKNNNYTISVWVSLGTQTASPHDKTIILHRADWGDKTIFWSGSPYDSIFVSDRNGSPVSSAGLLIPQNQSWQNIILASSNTSLSVYKNGILWQSTPRITQANWDSLYLGSFFGGYGINGFQGTINGKLDDIGIWNRTLAPSEIKRLYESCQVSINTQPTNQTQNVGATAYFSVVAGGNATYQWQTDLGLGFQNISNAGQYSGATNDTLAVSNITLTNNNQNFRCIITEGLCSDTTIIVSLSVNNCQISFISQPSNQSAIIGSTAQFISSVSNQNASYQWQTDLGLGFQNLSDAGQYNGALNDTLTISNLSFSNNNQSFRCIITVGSCKDTTRTAILTINNTVSIVETIENSSVLVYPNPCNDLLYIASNISSILEINIFNATGNFVMKITPAQCGAIDVSQLPSGSYIAEIRNKDITTKKIWIKM